LLCHLITEQKQSFLPNGVVVPPLTYQCYTAVSHRPPAVREMFSNGPTEPSRSE
jgi:hypothetical protein